MPTPQVPAQRWVPRKLVPVFSADKMLLHATFRLPFLKRHFDKGFDLNGVHVTYGPPSASTPMQILITAPTEAALQEALNRYHQLVSNIVVILIEHKSQYKVTTTTTLNPPSPTLMPHTDARNDDSSAVTVSVNNSPNLIAIRLIGQGGKMADQLRKELSQLVFGAEDHHNRFGSKVQVRIILEENSEGGDDSGGPVGVALYADWPSMNSRSTAMAHICETIDLMCKGNSGRRPLSTSRGLPPPQIFSADKMLPHAAFHLPILKRHFDKGFDLNGVHVTYGPPSASTPMQILITAPTEAALQEALNRYQQLVSNIVVILIEHKSEPEATTATPLLSAADTNDSSFFTLTVRNSSFVVSSLIGQSGIVAEHLRSELSLLVFGEDKNESTVYLHVKGNTGREGTDDLNEPAGVVLCAEWPSVDSQRRAVEHICETIARMCCPDLAVHSTLEAIPHHISLYPFLKPKFIEGFGLPLVQVIPLFKSQTDYVLWQSTTSTSCAPTHIRITAPTEASLQEALNRYQQLVSNIVVIFLVKPEFQTADANPHIPIQLAPCESDGSAFTVTVRGPNHVASHLIGVKGSRKVWLREELSLLVFGEETKSEVELWVVAETDRGVNIDSNIPAAVILRADWPNADSQRKAIACLLDSIRLICDPELLSHSIIEAIPHHMFCYQFFKRNFLIGFGKNTVKVTPLIPTGTGAEFETWDSMYSASCAPTHVRIAAATEDDLQEALDRYQNLINKVVVVILVKSESQRTVDLPYATTVTVKSPSSMALRLRGRHANPLRDEISRHIFGDQSESKVDLLAVTARINERDNQSSDPVGIVLCADWPNADSQRRAIECLLDFIRPMCDPDHLSHSIIEVIPHHMFCYPMLRQYFASGLGMNTVEVTPLIEKYPVFDTWDPNTSASCAPTHVRIAAATEDDFQEALDRYQNPINKVVVVILVKSESQSTAVDGQDLGGYDSRVEMEILVGNPSENSSDLNGSPFGFAIFSEWPQADSQRRALEYIIDTVEYVSDAEEKVRIEALDINDMLERGIERLIVIGDVHGCHAELIQLLKNCGHSTQKDMIVFLGDLVDKGPHTREVVTLVSDLTAHDPKAAMCVLGNHEIRLLNAYDVIVKRIPWAKHSYTWVSMSDDQQKRYATLAKGLASQHVEYLRRCPHIITVSTPDKVDDEVLGQDEVRTKQREESQKLVFVHAGIPPVFMSPEGSADSLSKQRIEQVTSSRFCGPDGAPGGKNFWTEFYGESAYTAHGYVFYGHCGDARLYHQQETQLPSYGEELSSYPPHEKYAMCLDSQCATGGSLTAAIIDLASLLPLQSTGAESPRDRTAHSELSFQNISPFAPRNLRILSVRAAQIYHETDRRVCYEYLKENKCKKPIGGCRLWHPTAADMEDDNGKGAAASPTRLKDIVCWFYKDKGWCPLDRAAAFRSSESGATVFSACPMKHPAPSSHLPKKKLCRKFHSLKCKDGYQCGAVHLHKLCFNFYAAEDGCQNLYCNDIHENDLPKEFFSSLRSVCPLWTREGGQKYCRINEVGKWCPKCSTQ